MDGPNGNGLNGIKRYLGEKSLEAMLGSPSEVALLTARVKTLEARWKYVAAVALASWGAFFASKL